MKLRQISIFLFLSVAWGSNFIFVKLSTAYISPLQVTLLRVLSGFVPILAYAIFCRHISVDHIRHMRHSAAMASFSTIGFLAVTKGTALLPSSVAGMLNGASPIFAFACAALFLDSERIDSRKIIGVAVGFVGIVLIAKPWSIDGTIDIRGVGWMALGALSLGGSFVYVKKYVVRLNIPPSALAVYQIGITIVVLLIVTPFEGTGAVFADTRAWTGLLFGLGLCGTGLAYIAYYRIVEELGALAASGVAYAVPVVAVLIGTVLFDEPLAVLDIVAMSLICSGVFMIQSDLLKGRKSSG
ncbi:DMT family transporter [Bosea sp. (in: a-proteobacteria)]|uniref:DMT family transporter n=1 Tax=Bosea sp. (in: a-proteobacteria) TaxID=1871050 RepID=UPI002612C658|nr:DMT family transporter [Bosea sp. (in: a-proteobacteria)]MCO5089545.1 DMT family transporter [Bosea sp. (in: a-proteobacteria)]